MGKPGWEGQTGCVGGAAENLSGTGAISGM